MRADSFRFFREWVQPRSGLALAEDKEYLVESRLLPIARHHGFATLDELAGALREAVNKTLEQEVMEALTTNESSFFRDIRPFTAFREKVIPHMVQHVSSARPLRIWSAACSTGQEPYSIAMALKEETTRLKGCRVQITATDLASKVVRRAEEGDYSQFEAQRGMPVQLLLKYFSQEGDRWRIKPDIRSMVQFKTFNLLDSFASLGEQDVVFCRNVLIYFDRPTKIEILDKIHRLLPPHGILLLGGSENVISLNASFRPFEGVAGIFQKM